MGFKYGKARSIIPATHLRKAGISVSLEDKKLKKNFVFIYIALHYFYKYTHRLAPALVYRKLHLFLLQKMFQSLVVATHFKISSGPQKLENSRSVVN